MNKYYHIISFSRNLNKPLYAVITFHKSCWEPNKTPASDSSATCQQTNSGKVEDALMRARKHHINFVPHEAEHSHTQTGTPGETARIGRAVTPRYRLLPRAHSAHPRAANLHAERKKKTTHGKLRDEVRQTRGSRCHGAQAGPAGSSSPAPRAQVTQWGSGRAALRSFGRSGREGGRGPHLRPAPLGSGEGSRQDGARGCCRHLASLRRPLRGLPAQRSAAQRSPAPVPAPHRSPLPPSGLGPAQPHWIVEPGLTSRNEPQHGGPTKPLDTAPPS